MKNKALIFIIILLPLIAIISAVINMTDTSADNEQTQKSAAEHARKTTTEHEISAIDEIMADMTLEEKVGQMFMGCFYNGTPSAETVAQYKLGGIVLFSASFESTPPEDLKAQLGAIDVQSNIRPLIAVDEEGGTVVRVSSGSLYRSRPFQSPRQLYAQGGIDAVIADTHEKNQLLKQLGINMNLAPVCDISQNPSDFMYQRSLGQDAETTGIFVSKTVKACLEDGMGCCLKHFPGYGNTSDTHNGIAHDNRTVEQLKESDLIPFQEGIDADAHSVLVSHNIVNAIDPGLPASLSPAIHRILRDTMGFDGVIITDDLSMEAITQFSPEAHSAILAINAGNDIICTGAYDTQIKAVLEAVKNGSVSENRIDESVRRILRMKLELGLLE